MPVGTILKPRVQYGQHRTLLDQSNYRYFDVSEKFLFRDANIHWFQLYFHVYF